MTKKYILFLCFGLTISFATGQSSNPEYDKAVQHVMSTLNCKRPYAEWVMSKIDEFSNQIQSDFEYIANSNDTYSKKIAYIPAMISRNFVSASALIGVSSTSRSYISNYSINQYLYRLVKIKERYGYTKVELLFSPDYLGIGQFYKTPDNNYELSITMWQIFRSWYGDSPAYSDATRKKFRLIFYVDHKNRLKTIKVDRVFVSETVNINKFKYHSKNKN
ncbi:MAG: hypothetical protein AAF617_00170 [Bacteroidota bacterium]